MAFKTACFPHQQEVFDIATKRNFFAILLEPGLGKSKIMLDVITHRKIASTLIVCPNTLVRNWADEITKHSDLSYVLLLGSAKQRIKKLETKADIYVINYDATRNLWPELCAQRFECLVLDESTYVKNPKSQQSKACYHISKTIGKKYILTGSPIMNNPLDAFGQYRIIHPDIFGENYYRFRARYAIMGGYLNKQVIKWVHMDEFTQKLLSVGVRKTKDECLDLPDKLYQTIYVDLPDEQRRVYNHLKDNFIAEFRDTAITAPVILTRLMRFNQITSGFIKAEDGTEHVFAQNPKLEWVMEFLTEYAKKTVVFCHFIKEMDMLKKRLDAAKIKYVCISGDTPSDERIENVRKFNETDIQVFIGQMQTAGIGINLTSAQYCIFMSNTYSYGIRVQAEDRLHRIGQKNANVTYIDLVANHTIDEAVTKALKKKEDLAHKCVGDVINML